MNDDTTPREAATFAEIEQRLALLPPEKAEAIRRHLQPAPSRPKPSRGWSVPPPKYTSWNDYLANTTKLERRKWCTMKAKRANRERLMSGRPEDHLTCDDVWGVLEEAKGRCSYCGSLALENRPSQPNGAPLPWEHVGRRIGSLGHIIARVNEGPNTPANLAWCCLWCNTWTNERTPGATDRGAVQSSPAM